MKWRRLIVVCISLLVLGLVAVQAAPPAVIQPPTAPASQNDNEQSALQALGELAVKGRAPKTGYSRDQFGSGWSSQSGCDTRSIILYRDLQGAIVDDECRVISGLLNDPYTGKTIQFDRADGAGVQIDHVVALSDAWQKGAQQLSAEMRKQLANDPLELLAVEGDINQQKSDADAASWLPPNKAFRCEYVARQIAVKQKYMLWVTQAEKAAIEQVLTSCPGQGLPSATIKS